ncbi:hypothetical protein [Hymenobacter volaticus]|uniref:DUF4177 domain-containing protein n=1 Tax=Hymenobacter volaticus TaxID=2932254 RepID=A0ABY4G4C6_9BACT|nr:hypothetical protein [Hymenobacter volaticus]UOQ65742.1 hypothetical protein MUN86_19770 [Hymenobacter volaticus]
MKHWLIVLTTLCLQQASAQSVPVPPLPEASLQPAVTATVLPPTNGVRYQYQSVRVENERRIWLVPAWQGNTKLEPRTKLFGSVAGELDMLLMTTLNELASEGWELLEIRTASQPVKAKQTIETSLANNDPKQPTYTGTTTIDTEMQTRYLFRRPLPK